MPSILSRLGNAYRAFRGGEGVAPIDVSWFGGGRGMPATFQPEQSLKAYGDNVWLYRSVLSIAYQIGSTEFKLAQATDDGKLEYVTEHEALKALAKPQPSKDGKSMLTGMDLFILTGSHMMLNGESFWLLENRRKLNGAPTFIQPLLPQHMGVQIAPSGNVLEYVYNTGSKETRFDPMDIVHFKMIHPENPYRGHSPVQPIRYAVDTHKKADVMNTAKLDNYAVPSGVLETEQQITPDEQKRILAQWRAAHEGVTKHGKTAMLPKGLKFNKTQETNQEMEFAEGKRMTRDEILANFGVGMEIMGHTESQTRANAEASIFVFMKFGVLPFLKKFTDTLNNDFLPAFPGTEGLKFVFDDPVPENMEEKRENARTMFDLGVCTPNELRQVFGKEPLKIDGMDTPYLDFGKVPIGQDSFEQTNTQAA